MPGHWVVWRTMTKACAVVINFLIRQRRALNILMAALTLGGLYSLLHLPQEEVPLPDWDAIQVSAVWPGASPAEMDEKVVRLINVEIKDLKGIREVSSEAREGVAVVYVHLEKYVTNLVLLQTEIAQRIGQIEGFPSQLEGPVVAAADNNIVWADFTLVFSGGNDLTRHRAWLPVEEKLRRLAGLGTLQILGDREARINIDVNALAAEANALTVNEVASKVQSSLITSAVGRLEQADNIQILRAEQKPLSVDDLLGLAISTPAGTQSLSELADVYHALAPERERVRFAGQGAWYIRLHKRTGADMALLAEEVNSLTEGFNAQFLAGGAPFELSILSDQSLEVARSLRELGVAIAFGVLLVTLVLWLFLGGKNAFYAAIGIPFAFLVSFTLMQWLGLSLNTLSIFGLILICGLVVDDAVVVIENINRHMERHTDSPDGRVAAIRAGISEVFAPILAATTTTIAAFAPLLFITGGTGEVIRQIPLVAILALLASLAECFLLLPIHIYHVRHNRDTVTPLNRWISRLAEHFVRLSARCLQHRRRALLLFGLFLLGSSAMGISSLETQVSESDEARGARFSIALAQGVDLDSTQRILGDAEEWIHSNFGNITQTVTVSGWQDYNFSQRFKPHLGSIELHFVDGRQAGNQLAIRQILAMLNNTEGIQMATGSALSKGPPANADIQIKVFTQDRSTLESAASSIEDALSTIEGVHSIQSDLHDQVRENVFVIDTARAAHYRLAAQDIARALASGVTGTEIGKMEYGSELVDLYVRGADARGSAIDAASFVSRPNGSSISLTELGHFEQRLVSDTIKRVDDRRYIKISAESSPQNGSARKLQKQIESDIAKLGLPPTVSLAYEGDFDEIYETGAEMLKLALVAIAIIYFVLAVLFRSYLQPLVVLLALPLAFAGVVWGLVVSNTALTLAGLAGVVGLIGIVVNDSLVWLCFYNTQRESGKSPEDAAVEAVKVRFRPIFITTTTTIFGLFPTAFLVNSGMPSTMAAVVIYGLATASLFLLLILPVFAVSLDSLRRRFAQSAPERLNTAKSSAACEAPLPAREQPSG